MSHLWEDLFKETIRTEMLSGTDPFYSSSRYFSPLIIIDHPCFSIKLNVIKEEIFSYTFIRQKYSFKKRIDLLIGHRCISMNMAKKIRIFGNDPFERISLDEHMSRRGRLLYLQADRLKLLYSAWITSNLFQLIRRWSTDPFDFD